MNKRTFARIDRKMLSFVRQEFGEIAEYGDRYLVTSDGVAESPDHARWWSSVLAAYDAARATHFLLIPNVVIDFLLSLSPGIVEGGGCHVLLNQEQHAALHDWARRLPGWDDNDPPLGHIDAWAMAERVAAAKE